ncbi:MAG: acyl carrier protein, partial [Huintestinicola sp.]
IMMLEELKEIMAQYIEVEPEDITEEKRIIEDLGFNSFDFMSLLGELEEKFEITVDETEIADIHTVGEVIEYIEKLKG